MRLVSLERKLILFRMGLNHQPLNSLWKYQVFLTPNGNIRGYYNEILIWRYLRARYCE